MKTKNTIKIMFFLFIISLSISITSSNALSNNQTITKMADLDMDGKQEKIVLKGTELKINDKSAYFGGGFELVGLQIIDINSKDKQKEVIVTERTLRGDWNYIFTYKNKDIIQIKEILNNGLEDSEIISSEAGFQIDKKNNLLLVGRTMLIPYAMHNNILDNNPVIYQKYKLENNRLKNVTPDETVFNIFDIKGNTVKWNVNLEKTLNIYADKKSTKIGFTAKKGEKITIISGNLKEKYLKVKNSKGKLGYIPMLFDIDKANSQSYDWSNLKSFKQYPEIDLKKEIGEIQKIWKSESI